MVDIFFSLWNDFFQYWLFLHHCCCFNPDKRVHGGFLWWSYLKFVIELYLSWSIFFNILKQYFCRGIELNYSHCGRIDSPKAGQSDVSTFWINNCQAFFLLISFLPHYEVIFYHIGRFHIIFVLFLNLLNVFMRAFNDVHLLNLHFKYICHGRYFLLITELFFTILTVFFIIIVYFVYFAKRVGFLWWFSIKFVFQIYSCYGRYFVLITEIFFEILAVSSSLFFSTLINVFMGCFHNIDCFLSLFFLTLLNVFMRTFYDVFL